MEEKKGKILSFIDDNTGYVSDIVNPEEEYTFRHQGARPTFAVNDDVTYLLLNNNGIRKAVNLGKPV